MNLVHLLKSFSSSQKTLIICALLIISTCVVYLQVSSHEFITFDDDVYVTENHKVKNGLTLEGFRWAFGFDARMYWHPLTWLSHMADCELFGVNPGMHHVMNLLFHLGNGLLLFIVLKTMTGSYWRSGFVAALFALHPVNVDTVAWIAERKNLLSTFFGMITIHAYAKYAHKRTILRYTAVFCFFTLSLLSKPTLVVLPFLLFLLDYWPLQRFRVVPQQEGGKRDKERHARYQYQGTPVSSLVFEKVPFMVLSLIAVFIAFLSIRVKDINVTTETVPMGLRIGNAIVSYTAYLCKMIWPTNLTGYYPYPDVLPLWQIAGSLVILVFISLLAIKFIFRAPYFMVGWLWFIGILAPVSGIIQGGLWPAIAERWAYAPFIGIFIAVAWGMHDVLSGRRYGRTVLSTVPAFMLLLLMILAWNQTGYWKDNISLFSHDIQINSNNFLAHGHLGVAYADRENYEKAIYHFQEVLRIRPGSCAILKNLGRVYNNLGNPDKSIYYYSEAIRYSPDDLEAHSKLGALYAELGSLDAAIHHLSCAVSLDPGHAQAHYNLGAVFARKGDKNRAVDCFLSALASDPDDAETHCSLGVVLMNQGLIHDAITHFNEALRLDPDYKDAHDYLSAAMKYEISLDRDIEKLEGLLQDGSHNDFEILDKLTLLYSRKGENEKALAALIRLSKIQPDNPKIYYNIACLSAKEERVDEAVMWLKKSIDKGFADWDLLTKDSDLNNIRGTHFYKDLIEKDQAFKAGR